MRFHTIAPISPASMNSALMATCCSLMMPPEMVFATSVERNAPTTFRTPASATAVLGLSAPVAMEVAMAFAVSWNPFVKSNTSAVTMTRPTTISVARSMRRKAPLHVDETGREARRPRAAFMAYDMQGV